MQTEINLMKHKYKYLIFSLLILVPGIISLFVYKLNLAIDFTGGSVFEYRLKEDIKDVNFVRDSFKDIFKQKQIEVETIVIANGNEVTVRSRPVETKKINDLTTVVSQKFPDAMQVSFETVGPAIGSETTKKAFLALVVASVGILFYIAYAFRNIPKPYSSFRFGVSALISMLHDAFVVLGIFSILGHFFHIEIDSLFITAILTVIGFSVHDTIVVFDRIRENLNKLPKSMNFEDIVNYSVVETLNRSLATSLTVLMTLLSLTLLGGESIKYFSLALLIGIASGTYSSIFNASPVLVIWENWNSKRAKKAK